MPEKMHRLGGKKSQLVDTNPNSATAKINKQIIKEIKSHSLVFQEKKNPVRSRTCLSLPAMKKKDKHRDSLGFSADDTISRLVSSEHASNESLT
ncbi:hypothetical protein AVEN_107186-1 [Araneus ventricosus]|uniref:Uncharacterized protein n=1 Tax=Araneus ventricosus TaxID=182803 RepID=A0A4Y2PGZ4_ARAVE|nr:hypothetical protein AVEN_107186-1 [Araneus ventricosus]